MWSIESWTQPSLYCVFRTPAPTRIPRTNLDADQGDPRLGTLEQPPDGTRVPALDFSTGPRQDLFWVFVVGVQQLTAHTRIILFRFACTRSTTFCSYNPPPPPPPPGLFRSHRRESSFSRHDLAVRCNAILTLHLPRAYFWDPGLERYAYGQRGLKRLKSTSTPPPPLARHSF